MKNSLPLRIHPLTTEPYQSCLDRMKAFTARRTADTTDEIWLVEHEPVFTQGLAGKSEHLLDPGDIPVIQTERGGQVTYHGPGQVLAYLLLDIRRRGLTIKTLVNRMEQSVIDLLASHDIDGARKTGAPGVYISQSEPMAGAKIAALGLKVSRGYTFHGLALNVDMDLKPFARINPCGYPDLTVVDMQSLASQLDIATVAQKLGQALTKNL